MIEETGRIVAREGEFAWVEARSRKDCPRCAQGRGCGGGLIGRWLGNRLHRVRARNPHDYAVGELVRISISERSVLLAALFVYALPLLGLVIGALAGHGLSGGREAFSVAGALAGMLLVFLLVRRWLLPSRTLGRRFEPTVTQCVEQRPRDCQAGELPA